MTMVKWILIFTILLTVLGPPSTRLIAADELPLIQELEQRRQQVLLRIEDLKTLKKQSELSLNRAKNVHAKARELDDAAAERIAAQAIAKAKAALAEARLAMRTEQGNLNRINNFLDQKDKIVSFRPKTRVLVHKVPNPMQLPMGSWLRYVKSDRAGLIMDALEEGKGDLDDAIDYLDRQIIQHGGNMISESALSYLEGLRTSYIAAGAEYRAHDKGDGTPVSIESKSLLRAILDGSGARKWPGPANPNPENKPLNKLDWRVMRAEKMLSALENTPNDLEQTYADLQGDKEPSAANAEHYLRGAFAYWDFLGTNEGK